MKNSISLFVLVTISIFMLAYGAAEASTIVGIAAPVNSDDATSHPSVENIWSVSAPPFPFDISSGIGYIVNPVYPTNPTAAVASDFSRHDHMYSSPHVPDPLRAVVTYQFDMPTVVDQLEVIQHSNGMTNVEGFVGNSLGSLTSIGSMFGPSGDNTTPNGLPEGGSEVFDFNNDTAGTYFQFIVRKTNVPDGWATYRAFPRLGDGTRIPPAVPEPSTIALLLPALFAALARRRQ